MKQDADQVLLIVEKSKAILKITLNRPQSRNPLSFAIQDQLQQTLQQYVKDETLKLVIITGAGDKAFAAGGDLKELMSVVTEEEARQMADNTKEVFQAIRDFPVPVIAALNGDALGGGGEFAIACDLRIAAAHARIGFIQGTIGVSTAWGGAHDLMHLVGPASALRLMCSAELLDANAALTLGLFDQVAKADQDLEAAMDQFIKPMLRMSPHILRTFKSLSRTYKNSGRQDLDQLETEHLGQNWIQDAHWQAIEKLFPNKE